MTVPSHALEANFDQRSGYLRVILGGGLHGVWCQDHGLDEDQSLCARRVLVALADRCPDVNARYW